MSWILSRNCILIGDLDTYCLVCSSYMPGEDVLLSHITSPQHKANLKLVTYLEKYKKDFIKKVNGIYLCEVCNRTFSTAAKVGIHVTEDTHVKERRRRVRRVANSVLIENTLIEERAWNGLVQDTCVLCNADFEDLSAHVADHNHVLNVIKSSVIVDSDNNVYRKVDDGYHCLSCNKVICDITVHVQSVQHAAAFVKYDNTKNEDNIHERIKKQTMHGNSQVIRDVIKEPTITCNKALTDNNFTIGKVGKKPQIITEELEIYAKEHGFTVNHDAFNMFCPICKSVLPATKANAIEHLAGKKHTTNVLLPKANKHCIQKIPSKDFIRKTNIVDSAFGRMAIVNGTFCIDFHNFFCLDNFGRSICQFCCTELGSPRDVPHLITPSHSEVIRNSYVITSLKQEFVRQVNSLYHCGFCGVVENEFDKMLSHLATIEHKVKKNHYTTICEILKTEYSLH